MDRFQFYPDYHGDSLNYTTLWKKKVFKEVLTIHPVKKPENLLSIHHFYKTMEYKTLEKEIRRKSQDLSALCKHLPEDLVPPPSYKSGCSNSTGNATTATTGSSIIKGS